MRLVLVLLQLIVAGAAWGQQPELPRSTYELQIEIQKILEQNGTPAAGVALVDRDAVRWAAGIGTADRAGGRAADADTLFRVGSISKSFVAVAALMLVESGELALDERVSRLIPDIPFQNPWEQTAPVQVVHLLEHTTGFDDIHLAEYAHRIRDAGLREVLQYHPDSRVSRVPPGQHFSYANSGPAMAAYVIERVSGEPFEQFVQRRIFAPLGMNTASWVLTDAVQQRLAKGYWKDGRTPAPYEHLTPRPSGALNVSPRELGQFVQMLLARGRYANQQLLSAESVARMERPTSTLAARAGIAPGYGLGSYTRTKQGFTWHGHAGGVSNYLASYAYLPEHGVGYVLMINAPHEATYGQIDELLRRYLTVDLKPPQPAAAAAVSSSELLAWRGYYEPMLTRPELARFLTNLLGVVFVQPLQNEGVLMARSLNEVTRLVPLGDGRFRRAEDPAASVAFIKHDGQLLIQGAISGDGSLVRIPAWKAWLRWIAAIVCLLLMASTVVYALVWLPRRLFGHKSLDLGLRILPLLAVAMLAGAFGLFYFTEDLIGEFGRPTPRSYAFWLLTWLFALFSLLTLWRALGGGSTAQRSYAALVGLACLATAGYLYYWDVLGLRSWEY